MRLLLSIAIILILSVTSCSTVPPKLMPEYVGVDPVIRPLYDEYIWLSMQNNISFNKRVTIGFKKINRGLVVGLCTYGVGFREIDIDMEFWNNSGAGQKIAVIYHELTHCFCNRDHDHDGGDKYPSGDFDRLMEALRWKIEGGPKPGYLPDGCPSSLMFPTVVESNCLKTHYGEYIKEMFEGCEPW